MKEDRKDLQEERKAKKINNELSVAEQRHFFFKVVGLRVRKCFIKTRE